MEGIVHVGVGGGEPTGLQPTEDQRKQIINIITLH